MALTKVFVDLIKQPDGSYTQTVVKTPTINSIACHYVEGSCNTSLITDKVAEIEAEIIKETEDSTKMPTPVFYFSTTGCAINGFRIISNLQTVPFGMGRAVAMMSISFSDVKTVQSFAKVQTSKSSLFVSTPDIDIVTKKINIPYVDKGYFFSRIGTAEFDAQPITKTGTLSFLSATAPITINSTSAGIVKQIVCSSPVYTIMANTLAFSNEDSTTTIKGRCPTILPKYGNMYGFTTSPNILTHCIGNKVPSNFVGTQLAPDPNASNTVEYSAEPFPTRITEARIFLIDTTIPPTGAGLYRVSSIDDSSASSGQVRLIDNTTFNPYLMIPNGDKKYTWSIAINDKYPKGVIAFGMTARLFTVKYAWWYVPSATARTTYYKEFYSESIWSNMGTSPSIIGHSVSFYSLFTSYDIYFCITVDLSSADFNSVPPKQLNYRLAITDGYGERKSTIIRTIMPTNSYRIHQVCFKAVGNSFIESCPNFADNTITFVDSQGEQNPSTGITAFPPLRGAVYFDGYSASSKIRPIAKFGEGLSAFSIYCEEAVGGYSAYVPKLFIALSPKTP